MFIPDPNPDFFSIPDPQHWADKYGKPVNGLKREETHSVGKK
jgi:hypothetical protein